ncbi:MAG: ATP-binding protein [Burkholderiaceae bacterium]
MKPGRWACFSEALLLACAALLWPGGAFAVTQEPARAAVLLNDASRPPPDGDARWSPVSVPDAQDGSLAWYKVEFQVPAGPDTDSMMLYLPYFYGGGSIWVNRQLVARVPENSSTLRVHWERPLLIPLPMSTLHAGTNMLHLRVGAAQGNSGTHLPQLVLGPQSELQPQFDRRLFVVRTVPLVTVVAGSVMGLFVIGIWLGRREEVLYGMFGAAALLWAVRTTTFVVDVLPAALWPLWRLLYHASTGGFIIVMALFALQLAGWNRRPVAIGLGIYGLLGPMLYAVSGDQAEEVVGRWWVLGLIPVGLSIAVVTFASAWRQRALGTSLIAAAVALAVLSGVHDYLVAWDSPLLSALAPGWATHRLFLLHHGANLLLVAMGVVLTMRFVRLLHAVEEANRTLEARVQVREREIAASYARIAALQQDRATFDERQRIMQDLHDGLGAQLFTSLLRAERGALDADATAAALRGAIDEMRMAIEALASAEGDFRTAFGNFRFRWDQRLRDAGVAPHWDVDLPDAVLPVAPHDGLQLLRVAQEALTNILKHAHAHHVHIRLQRLRDELVLEVSDDGVGLGVSHSEAGVPIQGATAGSGRGVANMRARAQRLHARLFIGAAHAGSGTRVTLQMPMAS